MIYLQARIDLLDHVNTSISASWLPLRTTNQPLCLRPMFKELWYIYSVYVLSKQLTAYQLSDILHQFIIQYHHARLLLDITYSGVLRSNDYEPTAIEYLMSFNLYNTQSMTFYPYLTALYNQQDIHGNDRKALLQHAFQKFQQIKMKKFGIQKSLSSSVTTTTTKAKAKAKVAATTSNSSSTSAQTVQTASSTVVSSIDQKKKKKFKF